MKKKKINSMQAKETPEDLGKLQSVVLLAFWILNSGQKKTIIETLPPNPRL